jgi:hypothetical protein
MQARTIFKYNYTFLYQSMAAYATTLAVYLVVRGMMHKEFSDVFYDPVVYLLSIIIIASALAVLYNALMRRRIELTETSIILQSAGRLSEIDRKSIKFVKIGFEKRRGIISHTNVITIVTNSRRRPYRIRPNNFEQADELFSSIKQWAGEHVQAKPRRNIRPKRRPRS